MILFTYLNWGPEIVWRTPLSVVGAPYAKLESLRDTSVFFHDTTDDSAISIVKARGVDLVMVCRGGFERYERGGDANLHNRLVAGNAPNWLRAIDLPAELADQFRLYRVEPNPLHK